jgi:hypothetical protein
LKSVVNINGQACVGKKAGNKTKYADKQPDRFLLWVIIIDNGFCYRYIISLVGPKNWLTNNWLTKTKGYNFLTKLILRRGANAGIVITGKELIFRHDSYEISAALKVFNRQESVTRTPIFKFLMVIMISLFEILKPL